MRALAITITVASMLILSACASNEPQQPSPEEQQRIQAEQQRAAEQQKRLTSGYGDSMKHVAPNTGATPKNSKSQGAQKAPSRTQPTQQQQ